MLLKNSDACSSFKAGDVIFRQGDEGRVMYIIQSGVVELRVGDLVIGAFATDDIFGEMAIVDLEARSATATAVTDCQLVAIDNKRFQDVIRDVPDFATDVMRVMAERLRNMNQATNVLRRRVESHRLQALTDALTGLGNRRLWDERMLTEESRCRRLGYSACVLSIDLDGLKKMNDTEGHAKGDLLIKGTADALLQVCRSTDVVARLGGDEFGVIALECHIEAGRLLVQSIEELFKTRGISASIGLAVREKDGSLQQASEKADQAMYAIKRTHGGR